MPMAFGSVAKRFYEMLNLSIPWLWRSRIQREVHALPPYQPTTQLSRRKNAARSGRV